MDAYIDGYELAEPALFAKDASFGRSLEGLFTQYRNAIKQGVAPEEIDKAPRRNRSASSIGPVKYLRATTTTRASTFFSIPR